MAEYGIQCSLSRSGNVWDNAAMESFFSTLKTERTAGKVYRTRDAARADVFDYIERFYNPRRRHSTLRYLSPIAFEDRQRLAELTVHGTGGSSTPIDSDSERNSMSELAPDSAVDLANQSAVGVSAEVSGTVVRSSPIMISPS